MNRNADNFSKELLDVPAVPEDILPAVRIRIHRRKSTVRHVSILAVVALLSAGMLLHVSQQKKPVSDSTQEVASYKDATITEIDEELQIAHDFLNGTTIEEEISMYALVDTSVF